MFRSPAPQPKRELERSLEALNQLAISDSDTTKQSSVSDGSHKEALVYIFYLFIFFTYYLCNYLFIGRAISKCSYFSDQA